MANYKGCDTDEIPADYKIAGAVANTVANGSQDAVQPITVTASPFTYTVPAYGTVNISGGSGVAIAIKRGGTSTNLGGVVGHFLQSKGDQLVVTYTTAPTMVFIPN